MPRLRVDPEDKYPRVYWPQELKAAGFVGEMEVVADAFSATVIHPRATLEQLKRSLEVAIQEIELRMERTRRGEHGPEPGTVSAMGMEGVYIPPPVAAAPVALLVHCWACHGAISWPPDVLEAQCPHCGRLGRLQPRQAGPAA